jgi:hypothetical protein
MMIPAVAAAFSLLPPADVRVLPIHARAAELVPRH